MGKNDEKISKIEVRFFKIREIAAGFFSFFKGMVMWPVGKGERLMEEIRMRTEERQV